MGELADKMDQGDWM